MAARSASRGATPAPTSRPGWARPGNRARGRRRHDSPMSSFAPSPVASTTNRVRRRWSSAPSSSRSGRKCSGEAATEVVVDRARRGSGSGRRCRSCRSRRGTRPGQRHSTAERVERADRGAGRDDLDVAATRSRCGSPGTTSQRMYSRNWFSIACGGAASPSCASSTRPSTLSQLYTLIRPASSSSPTASTRWKRSISSESPPAVGNTQHRRAVVSPSARARRRARRASSTSVRSLLHAVLVRRSARSRPATAGSRPRTAR